MKYSLSHSHVQPAMELLANAADAHNCWLCSGGSYLYCSSYLVFSYQSFYNQSSWECATVDTYYLIIGKLRGKATDSLSPTWSLLVEKTKKHHSFCRHSLVYNKKIQSKCFEFDSKEYIVSLTHRSV